MEKKEFITSDLFTATALICSTGLMPNDYIRTETGSKDNVIISFRWSDKSKLPVEALRNHELKIEPLTYKETFVILRDKMFEIKNNRG